MRDDFETLELGGYSIVYEPIPDEFSHLAPPEIQEEIGVELYQLVMERPREAIDRLIQLKALYPTHPRIYNYLAKGYLLLGDTEKMDAIIEENFRRNPGYLFARVNYGDMCLRKGECEKIPAILDNRFDLKLLYPKRHEFHITEAVSFFGLMGRYYFAINDIEKSKQMLAILKNIAPHDENTQLLKRQIRFAKALKVIKGLTRRRE